MKIVLNARRSGKNTHQKRVDALIKLMDMSGENCAKYVCNKISEDEFHANKKAFLLEAYNALFKGNARELKEPQND